MASMKPPTHILHNTDLGGTTSDWNNSIVTSNNSSFFLDPVFLPCDNPRNVVSPFVAEMVDLVVFCGILPVLVTSGVITNVINMVVFARQGLSDRIHLCLFSLAVSDTGFLLFLMSGKSYALVSLLDPVAGSYWLQAHNGPVLGNYLAFLVISNTITALISMERALCVLSPLKAAKFLKTKYMGLVIVVVAVYTLTVMNTALGVKYLTVQVRDPVTNTSTFITSLGPLYQRYRTLIDVLYLYILLVTLPFIALVVVIGCTTAIILRLRVTANWRRKTVTSMTSVEKQEVTVTRMLVTVCCVFVACMTPSVTRGLILFSRLPGFLSTGYLCNVFKVTIALTHMLEALNASINFHIYLRQSSRYRSTLMQLCRCVLCVPHGKGLQDVSSQRKT
ncbi:hypothetical protein ACOMHN_054794 [Nucella lapillus]